MKDLQKIIITYFLNGKSFIDIATLCKIDKSNVEDTIYSNHENININLQELINEKYKHLIILDKAELINNVNKYLRYAIIGVYDSELVDAHYNKAMIGLFKKIDNLEGDNLVKTLGMMLEFQKHNG